MTEVARIIRISLTTADAEASAAFYCDALGFVRAGAEERAGQVFAGLMNLPEARAHVVTLRLGEQEIELVQFMPGGAAYPADSQANDLVFQHFAIVVADMQAAYTRLGSRTGWQPVSKGGPQQLPAGSGGVTAYKFRDPDGHPLELLAFPPDGEPSRWRQAGPGVYLGIDHSAISVADTATSIAFYQSLGFAVAGRSLNHGEEQARLDGLADPVVEVTALQPQTTPPHLELLCYRNPPGRPAPTMRSNDIAKTRLVLEANAADLPPRLIRDPDGHDLILC